MKAIYQCITEMNYMNEIEWSLKWQKCELKHNIPMTNTTLQDFMHLLGWKPFTLKWMMKWYMKSCSSKLWSSMIGNCRWMPKQRLTFYHRSPSYNKPVKKGVAVSTTTNTCSK